MRQPRNLAARIILMNDVLLAGSHQLRFRALHRLDRGVTIALRDRFLDDPDRFPVFLKMPSSESTPREGSFSKNSGGRIVPPPSAVL